MSWGGGGVEGGNRTLVQLSCVCEISVVVQGGTCTFLFMILILFFYSNAVCPFWPSFFGGFSVVCEPQKTTSSEYPSTPQPCNKLGQRIYPNKTATKISAHRYSLHSNMTRLRNQNKGEDEWVYRPFSPIYSKKSLFHAQSLHSMLMLR